MNYLVLANENLFNKETLNIEYEIDKLSKLKKDLSNKLNDINKFCNPIVYDESEDAIFQNVNGKQIKLSVDYIGPSRYHAECRKIDKEIILAFLYATRELGGHILFPTQQYLINDSIKKSLNEIRSYRFKERIDYFLFELKCWYNNENKVSASKNVFEGNRAWFMQFGDLFENFIDYFCLNDFVDDDYNVYNLTSYNCIKGKYSEKITSHPAVKYDPAHDNNDYPKVLQNAYIPSDYSKYIIGCTHAIQSRTKRMTCF